MSKDNKANAMWGGRFADSPDEIMEQINASIEVDKRLWEQDIELSLAHAEMLSREMILGEDEYKAIYLGLSKIKKEFEEGRFTCRPEFEDIHMNIEARLKDLIGDPADKLHTGRSRNDQVATSFRMWVRDTSHILMQKIAMLQDTLSGLSETHKGAIMPGFTHLQAAQPVTLGAHMDAYFHMLARDKSRFQDCIKRLNESPLGAAALAGTSIPINRDYTSDKLGFDRPMSNTLDAVSARDFATEFLFACAQCGLNLSRLAEEIVLWATPQFGFIRLSDSWSTGSSIMPQKKNPDAAELIRGKTGRLTGNLVQLMTVMKGLPLAYNKDMQEDKEPVFDSADTLVLCLEAMNGMLASAAFQTGAMLKATQAGFITATELADWLVMELNLPFREAHHITGAIVKMAEEKNCRLDELSLEDMQSVEPKITDGVFSVLSVENAIKSRNG